MWYLKNFDEETKDNFMANRPLARRVVLKWMPILLAKFLRMDPDAIRRPLLHKIIWFQGPDPLVWKGPIFIHVPKAAGTSILSTGVQWSRGHQPFRFYERHRPATIPMPFTFAVVRNPLDRYISAFYYLQGGGITGQDRLWSERNIPAGGDHNSFIDLLSNQPRLLKQMHFRPQITMLLNKRGEVGPDRILRWERLAEDWPEFAEQHGLRRELKWSNAGKRERPETTERCRNLVKKVYERDFREFGYGR